MEPHQASLYHRGLYIYSVLLTNIKLNIWKFTLILIFFFPIRLLMKISRNLLVVARVALTTPAFIAQAQMPIC